MHELDLLRISKHIALTTCGQCSQIVPLNFAYIGKYNTGEEHFCSVKCQDLYEEELSEQALKKLRNAGL